jgi:hypothetical protein
MSHAKRMSHKRGSICLEYLYPSFYPKPTVAFVSEMHF